MEVRANAASALICWRRPVAPGRTNTRTFSPSRNTGQLPHHAQHRVQRVLVDAPQELDVPPLGVFGYPPLLSPR
jgi:hypothetical protein